MNIIVNSDRTVEKEYTEKDGSQNENRITELNFTLPEEYSGFVTKIAFITEDGNFSDYIENGTYILKNNITKYREVLCFVWLTDSTNNKDFRSEAFKLEFYYNEDPSDYIPSEQEKSQIELLFEELDEKIQEVTELEENVYTKDETYSKEEIDTKVSSVYKYRGTVATYNDLPSTGLTVGDVYNVETDGSNYAWTGTEWDKLGGDIDLSGYYTKTETDTLLGAKQNTINAQNKLNSDLVDDTNHTNKFVTASEKNSWNAKYNKPSGGIPKTDLASDVQTSLEKADTAVQDVSGKEDKTNKTSIIDENSTNTQYTGAKAVYDALVLRDEKISDLKTKNELLVKDHVPIENTGTELQLTGTGDLPMELFPYGNISQETREGYNEIDITDKYGTTSTISGIEFKFNNDGTIILDGTSISAINFIVKNITLQPNNYYLSGCPSTGGTGTYFTQLVNPTTGYYIFNNSYETGNGIAFNLNAETSCNYRIHIENGITLNKIIWKPLLCKSTTAKPYEAYGASPSIEFESPAKVVDGEYEIISENKNRFNAIIDGKAINIQTGKLQSVAPYSVTDFIPVEENDQYGFYTTGMNVAGLLNIACYDKNKNYTNQYPVVNAGGFYTFTIPTGVKFLRGVCLTNKKDITYLYKNVTMRTDYIEHKGQTASINTSPNPLYSENDCYKYLTSEQATALGLNTGAGWYCYNEYANQDFTSGVSSVTINDMKSDGIFYSSVGGTLSGTTITFDGTTTGEGNIVYELATPTYTKITNTNLIASLEALKDMQSYYSVTNISQSHGDNQADMRINANALKSLKAMQSETDTLLNAKVDKSSFVYDSNTETLSITMS